MVQAEVTLCGGGGSYRLAGAQPRLFPQIPVWQRGNRMRCAARAHTHTRFRTGASPDWYLQTTGFEPLYGLLSQSTDPPRRRFFHFCGSLQPEPSEPRWMTAPRISIPCQSEDRTQQLSRVNTTRPFASAQWRRRLARRALETHACPTPATQCDKVALLRAASVHVQLGIRAVLGGVVP